jgi:hypothetical protein
MMADSWRSAFLAQAQSDYRIFQTVLKAPDTELCHQLHYLQMASEKLAKAVLLRRARDRPPLSHKGFVQFLRDLSALHPTIRREFAFTQAGMLRAYLASLLPIAAAIENLAPDLAGNGPNPEYPWATRGGIVAPCKFDFPALRLWPGVRHRDARIVRMMQFLEICFRYFSRGETDAE